MLQIGMIVFPRGLITPTLYRVVDIIGSTADLKPMSLGGVPMQSPVTDLRRYRIRQTDEVSWEEEIVEVVRILNIGDEDLYSYFVEKDGETFEVGENELTIHEGSLAADAATMLAHGDAAPWELVAARSALLDAYFKATAKSMGIVGYNGARMLPIPHQINAARYALQFGRVRFLLADEVGLGKTVEAGLITATLRKYFPEWQAAIFVPESLTAQWAFEMYGKFGKTILALNEDDYDEDTAGIILPHERAREFSNSNQPEILIVDEAHRILGKPELVKAIMEMSRNAHAVLLLTATPVSDDALNLLKLLQVLDPEKFLSIQSVLELRTLQEKQPAIEKVLQAIRNPESTKEEIVALWKECDLKDAEIEAHFSDDSSEHLDVDDMHRTAALITDRYYPGARILRYRRKFLEKDNALPFRIVDGLSYTPTKEEVAVLELSRQWIDLLKAADLADDPNAQQVTATLIQAAHSSPLALADWLEMRQGNLEYHDGVTADPILLARHAMEAIDPLDGEEDLLEELTAANAKWLRSTKAIEATGRNLARAPRYETFLKFLKETFEEEPDSHILVFTGFEANVHPLWLLLRKALTDIAEVYEMSGRMTRIEREKNAFEFQEFASGCVLISDELGGEGRNFQFASHVVHFDLPSAPWIVEQRIGRCDRVGRDESQDVDSQVLVAKGQLDEAIFDFLVDGVGVFNESIAPIEGELDDIMKEMLSRCIDEGASGVLDDIESVAERLEEARERENAELLIRSAVGVEEARRIAKALDDREELHELRNQTIRYARLFESMVDEQEGGRVAITVGEFHTLHAAPGVLAEMIGFFDRKQAVRHERQDFFSPGHPFVRGLTMATLIDSPDRVAIIRRKGIKNPAIRFTFRISIPTELFQKVRSLDADLRPPLLSCAAANFPTRMQPIAITLKGDVIPSVEANTIYYSDKLPTDESMENNEEVYTVLDEDWEDTCMELCDKARVVAEDVADTILRTGVQHFRELADEVWMRVKPDTEDPEEEIAQVMDTLEALHVDIDSAVLILPAR